MGWWLSALLSALLAGATAVLAKIGMKGIDSTLATALRSLFILPLVWIVVTLQGNLGKVSTLTPRHWVFIALSAVAAAGSWLLYFYALDKADVTRVNPIDKSSLVFSLLLAFVMLGERPTRQDLLAAGLVAAGVLVSALKFRNP